MRFFPFFLLIFSACALREKAVEPAIQTADESATPPSVVDESPLFLQESSIGPWRLGMSRYQVLESRECRRFRPDRLTGGFECEAWESPIGKRRVSFVFDEQYRLSKIQLWIHDGAVGSLSATDWADASWRTLDMVSKQFEVTSPSNPEYIGLDQDSFSARAISELGELPFSLHFDIGQNPAARSRSWVSMIASPQGQFSFLFVAR